VMKIDSSEAQLRYLKPYQTGIYTWPGVEDISWQPFSDIIRTLEPPSLIPGRGIKLKFNITELTKI